MNVLHSDTAQTQDDIADQIFNFCQKNNIDLLDGFTGVHEDFFISVSKSFVSELPTDKGTLFVTVTLIENNLYNYTLNF